MMAPAQVKPARLTFQNAREKFGLPTGIFPVVAGLPIFVVAGLGHRRRIVVFRSAKARFRRVEFNPPVMLHSQRQQIRSRSAAVLSPFAPRL
jgi:hypothetical protein